MTDNRPIRCCVSTYARKWSFTKSGERYLHKEQECIIFDTFADFDRYRAELEQQNQNRQNPYKKIEWWWYIND